RLEVRRIEEALTDATRDWLGNNLSRFLPKTIDQISNCVVTRRTVEARMSVSNMQLALPKGSPKLFVHGGLGRYRGECRLMVLRASMRSIERWTGALHQMAVGFHFSSLASGLGAPSLAAQ